MRRGRAIGAGYAAWSLELLQAAVVRLDALVVDVRFMPWGGDTWSLPVLRERFGPRYHWAGKSLGNRAYREGRIEYVDLDGRLEKLRRYLDGGRDVFVLCRCADTASCHCHGNVTRLREASYLTLEATPAGTQGRLF